MDLSVFVQVPFSVESVPPKQTLIGISLMVALAVRAFERVRAWFALLGFKPRRVDLGICLATPTKFSIVFRSVGTITFDVLGTLDPA